MLSLLASSSLNSTAFFCGPVMFTIVCIPMQVCTLASLFYNLYLWVLKYSAHSHLFFIIPIETTAVCPMITSLSRQKVRVITWICRLYVRGANATDNLLSLTTPLLLILFKTQRKPHGAVWLSETTLPLTALIVFPVHFTFMEESVSFQLL
jgi:hypothetical protein